MNQGPFTEEGSTILSGQTNSPLPQIWYTTSNFFFALIIFPEKPHSAFESSISVKRNKCSPFLVFLSPRVCRLSGSQGPPWEPTLGSSSVLSRPDLMCGAAVRKLEFQNMGFPRCTLRSRKRLRQGNAAVVVPPVGIEPTPDDYKSTARPSCDGGTSSAERIIADSVQAIRARSNPMFFLAGNQSIR